MINPAKYNSVLQKASDEQLMNMLRRPDKIPSQFVVAEINRRQNMRQAAAVEQRRQARMQEMAMAQQQQAPMAMPQQGPQAMGMQSGGSTLLSTLGLNTNSPVTERYGIPPFDPNRETVAEYNFRVNQARRAKLQMEKLALADSGMEDIDEGPPPERPAASSIPTNETEPFFKFGGVNPEAVFSDGSPADIVKAASLLAPQQTSSSAGRNTPPRANVTRPNTSVVRPEKRGDRARRRDGAITSEAKREAGIRAAIDGMINQNMSVRDAEGMYSNVASLRQGNTPAPVGGFPGAVDFTPALGMGKGAGNSKNNKKEKPLTAQQAVANAYKAIEPDAKAAAALNNNEQTTNNEGGVKSLRGDPPQFVPVGAANQPTTTTTTTSSSTKPEAESGSNKEQPTNSVFGINSETKSYLTLVEAFNAEQEAMQDQLTALRLQLRDDDKKRLDGLATDLNSLLKAQKDLAQVYDKTSRSPENIIFRSMLDAGIALMGTKESNFLAAVSEAGKQGLATFDNLTNEQKENLFNKYSAAVDIAKSKVDITSQINQLARGIDATDSTILAEQMASQEAAFGRIADAQAKDIETGLAFSEDARAEKVVKLSEEDLNLKRDIFNQNVENNMFDRGIKERAQTVAETLANSQIFRDVASVQQADERLDIMAEQLDLSREELSWRQVAKKVDQQLAAIGLDKPADSVAKMEWMKTTFGEDGLKEILLGRDKVTGGITEKDILRAATDMYKSNPYEKIPGKPDATPEEAIAYYADAVRKALGQSGGGGGNVRIFNEDTGKAE